MPQKKKDPSVRARRNKAATRATLHRIEDETTNAEAYAAMNVMQLREAIDVLNLSRPADAQLGKGGTKADLVEKLVAAERQVPEMPSHPPRFIDDGDGDEYAVPVDWHTQTVAWWNEVWTSPMAAEWDHSDVHNVMVVALIYDDIWTAPTAKLRRDAMAEYRLQRQDLGLSPYSRRRLEWTIETANEAKERGEKRRTNGRKPAEKPQGAPKVDPRAHLAAVQ